jgi:acyl carrier protein
MGMVEAGTTKSKITNFILEKFPGARKRQLGDDTQLLEAGIVDSIGVLEIVAFIEQNFAIAVADDDLLPENFGSITCIARFVEAKIEPAALGEKTEGAVCDPR